MQTHCAAWLAGAAGFIVAAECLAAPVKLGCFTERAFQAPGVPRIWIVTFDEATKTADVFEKDLGGILRGTDVSIDADTIMFTFTTQDGKKGSAFISRTIGQLMIGVDGSFDKVLATCKKHVNAF